MSNRGTRLIVKVGRRLLSFLGNAQIILVGRKQVIHVHIATVLPRYRNLGLWCGWLHLRVFVCTDARLTFFHRLVSLGCSDDALEVVFVCACGLGERPAESRAG